MVLQRNQGYAPQMRHSDTFCYKEIAPMVLQIREARRADFFVEQCD